MNNVFLLLGANMGNPLRQLTDATDLLEIQVGKIIKSSSIYESEAWGVKDQPVFLNQALWITTLLSPIAVLKQCQDIENKLGRIRKEKWGARIIDIDVLYYDDLVIDTDQLTIPHPYISARRFVLAPLVEIADGYIHPLLNKSNNQLLKETKDPLKVQKTK